MKQCDLCKKKIGFFDGSFFVVNSKYSICELCKESYDHVINSTKKGFDVALNQFCKKYVSCSCLDDFRDYFINEHNKYIHDINIAGKEEKKVQGKQEKKTTGSKNQPPLKTDTLPKVNEKIGPFQNQDVIYDIVGIRGRSIKIYNEKVVITTKVTLGSLVTHNATDGEKTIYYADCIGIQYKPSNITIGYLQFETASSSGNNKGSNFFNENSFTFDQSVISNEQIDEVVNFIKNRIEVVKNKNRVSQSSVSTSVADELLKLKQLLDMGVLTQDEFDSQKNKLLYL